MIHNYMWQIAGDLINNSKTNPVQILEFHNDVIYQK